MIRNLLLICSLLITACSCTTTTLEKNTYSEPTASYQYKIECVTPEIINKFVYRGYEKLEIKGDTLVLTSADNKIYYRIPQGAACRSGPNKD